jgi:hypothetical protein
LPRPILILTILVLFSAPAVAGPCSGASAGTVCPDDGDSCTDDVCDGEGACVHPANTAPCDDGDACTTGDACDGGACVGEVALDCDDSNVCTDDRCDPAAGCVNVNNAAPCDDGDVCSVGDLCAGGACQAGPVIDCDDAEPCTTDTCDPIAGCVHLPNALACDDADPCTAGDRCDGGACMPGAPASCDDGNPCTTDACTPPAGCVHTPAAGACDDQNACTVGDACSAGVCVSGTPQSCSDTNPCTDDACDPATGCVHVPNEAACDDGDACTTADACAGGQCVAGPVRDCTDENPCTDDRCDPTSGCTHAPNDLPCDDGDACTVDDECRDGSCVGGAPADCNDANACTADSCSPETGCVHTPWPGCCNTNADCADADRCTTGERCVGQACRSDPRDCDDGDPCTDDACDPDQGCIYTDNAASCDDDDACTTADRCLDGACVGGPEPDCNDGNVCTTDGCDPGSGCVHVPNTLPCVDGDACTTADRCAAGTCIGGPAASCDDGSPCTTDSCNPAVGCHHVPNTNPCSDGNACTAGDVCSGGACRTGPPLGCDDGNLCTTDSCDPASGCVHEPNALPCNDGDACTTGDTCQGGVCAGRNPLYCGDDNPCTTDGCDPASGCTHVANTDPCDDGLFCTVNRCSNRTCVATPRDCGAAGDQCRIGTCDETLDRCVGSPKPDGTACSDGTVCTTGETCVAGRCTGGTPIVCDPCESCEAFVGCQIGPRPACHVPVVPFKAKLQLDDRPGVMGDVVAWKYAKGDLTSILEFRDPLTTNDFTLCIFDQGGSHLAFEATAPAGGTCGATPCWKALGARGFKYTNRERIPDGVMKVVLTTGAIPGTTKLQVKAKGQHLPPFRLPLAMPVVAELDSRAGRCWKSRHVAAGLLRSDARAFRALGD